VFKKKKCISNHFAEIITTTEPVLVRPKEKGFEANRFKALSVVWAGIEPATQGFSVLCSTD
jgi:hypothetical protein